MSEKPWDGRFSENTDKLVERFTASVAYDRRLYLYDIQGSIAHCTMLAKAGVIAEEERDALIKGLEQIREEIETGNFVYDDSLEDIHMHIEARLSEVIGKTARKLHTARSRNDQVALDIRMFLREETRQIISSLRKLRKTLTDMAGQHLDTVLPGYTHMQRAQPVLLAHHFMAYYEMFQRDTERFRDCLKRIEVMPLGSAALAGTTYPIDRHYTAKLLGFSKVSANSMDSVADRDFSIEFLSAAAVCMMHLSRMSEELILWSSSEFAFIEISDAFTTGSSIMPQKKNPDVCELVRGKTGRVYGDLMALLTLMKSLPMSYNRDMQEDKEPLFDAVDTLKNCLAVFIRMLPNIRVKADGMAKATESGFLNATDMADYLAGKKGIPFRQAHSITGKAVAYALSRQKELHELSLPELKEFSDFIDEELFDYLSTEQMIFRRQSFGGTAKENVKSAIAQARKCLENENA
ncbi:MAG: argininosuccinate lyase [Desulfococcaceae bacterium]|jgi:argininosuccinate lyase|nr:argininosuccinate lyase [Desulfococcaceae bacterium]